MASCPNNGVWEDSIARGRVLRCFNKTLPGQFWSLSFRTAPYSRRHRVPSGCPTFMVWGPRSNPCLKVFQQDVTGPVLEPIVPDGTLLSSAPSPLGLPDVYGLGTAFKSQSGAVTVSFEWDRVQYSTITRSLDQALSGGELELDDGHEIHLGFEYVFIGSSTPVIALRSGVWRDPDHRIRFVGNDEIIRALLPSGDDEVHFALGFGVAFQKFQMDFAVDLSDLVNTVSFSSIYSF